MNLHSREQGPAFTPAANLQRYDAHVLDRGASMALETGDAALAGGLGARAPVLWRDSLALLRQHVPTGLRKVHAGDEAYACGQPFGTLCLIGSGLFKIVNLVADGREQTADFFFKGDWLGFDGIPTGVHTCSAVALDMGELWTVRYDTLLRASVDEPRLMRLVLAAVSAQLARNRDASLARGTLSADARVADFLLRWALSLEERGMRTDEFDLHLSRADIGSHLGIRLESVSRALSRLTREGIIRFQEKGRRVISLRSLDALREFIGHSTDFARLI